MDTHLHANSCLWYHIPHRHGPWRKGPSSPLSHLSSPIPCPGLFSMITDPRSLLSACPLPLARSPPKSRLSPLHRRLLPWSRPPRPPICAQYPRQIRHSTHASPPLANHPWSLPSLTLVLQLPHSHPPSYRPRARHPRQKFARAELGPVPLRRHHSPGFLSRRSFGTVLGALYHG